MIALLSLPGILFVSLIGIFAFSAVYLTIRQDKARGVQDFEARWVDRNLGDYQGASSELMGDLRAVLKAPGVSSSSFADSSDGNIRRLIDLANSMRVERIKSSTEELTPLLRQVGADWKQETDRWAASLGIKK